MAFITEEVKTSLNLTDEQLNGLTPLLNDYIANVKNDFSKTANQNAEGILNGAALKVAEITKVQRNQGEKIADYILRANNEFNSSIKSDYESKKLDYETKLKEFDGAKGQKRNLKKQNQNLMKLKRN